MPHLPGLPPVEITLRRSARTRRFSLRISRLDGRVTLSMPLRARESEAMRFAHEQADWIRSTLKEMPIARPVTLGDAIPVEGRMLAIVQGLGRGVRIEGDSLQVPGDPAQAGARIGAFLKVLARDRLALACDRHAAALGRRYSRITLRDMRSRWGSCAHDAALMFSWRLIMAPPMVLDYVAAHEVAHLAEMNHSPAFWAVVEQLFPRWQVQRAWLHSHGQALHAYRFAAKGNTQD